MIEIKQVLVRALEGISLAVFYVLLYRGAYQLGLVDGVKVIGRSHVLYPYRILLPKYRII